MAEKDLQAKEKVELQTTAESTRDVPSYIPAVDIYESAEALTLVADMPGVGSENVVIDVQDNKLTLRGTVTLDENIPIGGPRADRAGVPGKSHRSIQDRSHHQERRPHPDPAQGGSDQTAQDCGEVRVRLFQEDCDGKAQPVRANGRPAALLYRVAPS